MCHIQNDKVEGEYAGLCVFGCARVGVRECTRRVKKICQMLNNGLACVKMNTVIGINDLMGA